MRDAICLGVSLEFALVFHSGQSMERLIDYKGCETERRAVKDNYKGFYS
jgi:hypothetical protein